MEEENKIELYEPAGANLERRRAEHLKPYEVLDVKEGPDLRTYWRIIQKRRWTILAILLVVFTVVLIATLKQKPVYQAEALLEIAKENPNILTVQELSQLENVSDNYLETQYKVLQSETLARRVVDEDKKRFLRMPAIEGSLDPNQEDPFEILISTLGRLMQPWDVPVHDRAS